MDQAVETETLAPWEGEPCWPDDWVRIPAVVVGRAPTRKRDRPKNRGARHRAGDHVLTFGRYKGKTLHRVRVENKGYLDWIADNEGFSMPSVRTIVRKYLGRRD